MLTRLTSAAILAVLALRAVRGEQFPLAQDIDDTIHTNGGQLLICQNDHFNPPCTQVWFEDGSCTNFPQGYHDSVSAADAPCGYTCRLYEDYNCGGKYILVASPGYSDLRETAYNDQLDSFSCTPRRGC
ncbi:hypothetical protein PM082_008162 [Marasmius tenuissimus]|nr:hypothetical protein PM082_008162 [Marasmius tenuissimus]